MSREPKIPHPKVFISYAWTSELYINQVVAFANSLQEVGIEVLFDKFELKPGNELNSFMERSVNDSSVTNVLLLLNKTYADKANNRQGGVGKETQIISEEVYNKSNQTKYIPIIFEKGPNGEIYKPTYLGSTYFIDLADEQKYETEFALLIKSLYGETVYRKSELGKMPNWVTEEITFPVKKRLEFQSIKNQTNPIVQRQEFRRALENISEEISRVDTNISSNNDFDTQYIEKYKNTIPLRDEYLELIKYSSYVPDSEKEIAIFLENSYEKISTLTGYRELLFILLHEIFIYTVVYYLKNELYGAIGYLLGRSYFDNRYSQQKLQSYGMFYCSESLNLDNAMRTRDNKQYLSGTAALWIEDLNQEFCSKNELVLADLICFNYMLFGLETNLMIHWFPKLYVYCDYDFHNPLDKLCAKMRSREQLESVLLMLNFSKKEQFIEKFKNVETSKQLRQLGHWGYVETYYTAPMFCDKLKSSEIGIYR